MKIKVLYDGHYPNLCSGTLVVVVNGKRHTFPPGAMCSGGDAGFTKDWDEDVTTGPWAIRHWPDSLPFDQRDAVLEAINAQVPHGCCGGCL